MRCMGEESPPTPPTYADELLGCARRLWGQIATR